MAFPSKAGAQVFPSELVSHFVVYDTLGMTVVVQRSWYGFPSRLCPLPDQSHVLPLLAIAADIDPPPDRPNHVPVCFLATGL